MYVVRRYLLRYREPHTDPMCDLRKIDPAGDREQRLIVRNIKGPAFRIK